MNDAERRLVAALKSGRYVQGKGALEHNGVHCSLGVACVEFALFTRSEKPVITRVGRWIMPDEVRAWLGWSTATGRLIEPVASGNGKRLLPSLVAMNDSGCTFVQIAHQVERDNVAKLTQ